jgi:hypothetical protein
LKRATGPVASLIICRAQYNAARHFVTGPSSHNFLYNGPGKIQFAM